MQFFKVIAKSIFKSNYLIETTNFMFDGLKSIDLNI